MEEGDDAYAILGVPKTANEKEIRTAYRKLALQYHPDKIVFVPQEEPQQEPTNNNTAASLEERKRLADAQFAKISNAYELLSDPIQRQEYDHAAASAAAARRQRRPEQQNDLFTSTTSDPLSSSSFFRMFHFHDPFEIFQRVFSGEESQNNTVEETNGSDAFHASSLFPSFQDPPIASFFLGAGRRNPVGADSFGFQDPWRMSMAPSPPMMFGNQIDAMMMMNPFPTTMMMGMNNFGSAGGGLFSNINTNTLNPMLLSTTRNNNNADMKSGTTSTSFFSSSTMSDGGGNIRMGSGGRGMTTAIANNTSSTAAAAGVSVSQSTRIINGRVETITERIIRKPDGTMERHVQTSSSDNQNNNDDGHGGNNNIHSNNHPAFMLPSASSSSFSQPMLAALPPPTVPMMSATTTTTTNTKKRRQPPLTSNNPVTQTTSTTSSTTTATAQRKRTYSVPKRKQQKVSK
jgi:curved DNA-binding protein CbpA